jgi:hypothetical protein
MEPPFCRDAIHGLEIAQHVEGPEDFSVAGGERTEHAIPAAAKEYSGNNGNCGVVPPVAASLGLKYR